MKCPYCTTENRDDRETCYHCGKDLAMLRLIVNKAHHHYNVALEHAERQRYSEALAELEHCLELDCTFVPAHVVMGTVYAKMEKFDAAERCWQTALSLDPHILKAHEYLGKSGLAKQAIPLLRRLRWGIGLALGMAVLFALAIAWQFRPSSERADFWRITNEIDAGNYGAALDQAQQLRDTARNPDIRYAARLLENAIQQRYEFAAIEMLTFLLDGKPLEAHQLHQRLVEKQSLPDRYRRQLSSLDHKAAEQAIAQLNLWRQQFDRGTLLYDDLARQSQRLSQIFSEHKDVSQQVSKMLASARQAWTARTLAQIPRRPLSTTETLTWLGRLHDVSNRVPENRDALTSRSKQLAGECVAQMEPQMDKLLAGKDPAPVRSALDSLQRLASYERTESVERLIERARDGHKRMAAASLRSRLSAATAADIPSLDTWVAAYEKETSVTLAGDPDTSKALARARQRLAAEVVTWCSDRASRFQKRSITNAEAKFVADRAAFVLSYSTAKTWRNTRDCVMFCAAIAWMQLGKPREALRWFEQLEKTYPESSYLPTATRYRQKIEEDLKIPIPPAP